MTILLTSLFMIILCFNVQAAPSQHNEIKEDNKEIEKLYDYISNMKNQYEILKDINAKDYVKNFMEKGESNISIKKQQKL